MKKILLTLLLGLGALNTASAIEGDADAGKNKSAVCAACHGVDGNGAVAIYPKLAGQSADYIAKQLADFKLGMSSGGKEGRADPIMGGMTMALSEQDMADLGAYFASQKMAPGSETTNETGKKLYLGGDASRGITACVACHGATGKGMEKAGFPVIGQQSAAYIKSQLEKFRSGTRANDKAKMMRNIAMKLEDADIEALTQYIASLK
ncbi:MULTISPECIES: c-type cytochrome [Colwelliaceae]|uniref:c-type cytochrome n=1 Tax=Colwelliaceae TaxID=267889 RepID=UPI000970366C|nr:MULTISPECIES: c-type cytochrome [Colwelliaceae]